jgi:hypothetical protein
VLACVVDLTLISAAAGVFNFILDFLISALFGSVILLLGFVGSKGRPTRCLWSSKEFSVQLSVFPPGLSRSVRVIHQL